MIYLICPTFASLAYKGALEHVYGKLELAHRARCHAVFFFFSGPTLSLSTVIGTFVLPGEGLACLV